MLTVDDALARVVAAALPKKPIEVSTSEALGLVLAEDVASDIDSPPHDKSLVDGYAVRSADTNSPPYQEGAGRATLTVLEQITAGQVPTRAVESGQATRIMTGAPLPQGVDAVVMVEHTETLSAEGAQPERVRLLQPIALGRNLQRRGASMRAGDVVLRAGHQLRAIEIGLLAEVGRMQVRVVPRPTVAVLATGDELTPPERVPGPGQIRNSNGPLLHAAVLAAGAEHIALGIARDEATELTSLVRAGLQAADVLVLSGGVSAGVLDLVPGVLRELGVEERFHKVRMKPGKPLWFGVLPGETPRLVFGLPGNPVSTLVCFHLFVRPALARLAGHSDARAGVSLARLSAPLVHRGDRPTYHPGRLLGDGALIEPLAWQGSADLRTLAKADALIAFPAGDREFAVGERVEVLLL